MSGKIVALILVVSGLIAGAAMYYFQVYAFYDTVSAEASEVRLTSVATGEPEAIGAENVRAIDADSSPLRYRACFETGLSQAMLTESYVVYEGAVPNVAPGWFDCFDAAAIGAALEQGTATAFLGESDIHYGFDRLVAIGEDGRGFVWHQINACGQAFFDGDPLPQDCPPPPEQ